MHKAYIIAQVQKCLADNLDLAYDGTVPDNPGKPTVAPEGTPVFPIDIMTRLEDNYRYIAIQIPDFESWMVLLEKVATELKLNPAQDFDKIASILNQFREASGKEPL